LSYFSVQASLAFHTHAHRDAGSLEVMSDLIV
jgi:hypothetical protein